MYVSEPWSEVWVSWKRTVCWGGGIGLHMITYESNRTLNVHPPTQLSVLSITHHPVYINMYIAHNYNMYITCTRLK